MVCFFGVVTGCCKQLAELVVGEDVPMPREKLSPFDFHQFRNPGIAWKMITGGLMDKFM
jgi:hypothetical protein